MQFWLTDTHTTLDRQGKTVKAFAVCKRLPSSVEYYARLGWDRWRGLLFIRTEDGPVPPPEDEVVMIPRLPRTPDLDLDAALPTEWREGEVW